MGHWAVLAEAFRYPAPNRLAALDRALADFPPGKSLASFRLFLENLRPLKLGQWEELYTRTWDLNPLSPPYIGFHRWGEDYKRGNFMAQLTQAYRRYGIEADGELPDHLVPVLRYLDQAEEVLPELKESLEFALQKMQAALKKSEPQNPYLHLLDAAARAAAEKNRSENVSA